MVPLTLFVHYTCNTWGSVSTTGNRPMLAIHFPTIAILAFETSWVFPKLPDGIG